MTMIPGVMIPRIELYFEISSLSYYFAVCDRYMPFCSFKKKIDRAFNLIKVRFSFPLLFFKYLIFCECRNQQRHHFLSKV